MIKNILLKIICLFFLSASIHAADTSNNKPTKEQSRLVIKLYKAMKKHNFKAMGKYIQKDPSILSLHNKHGRTPAEEARAKNFPLLAQALANSVNWGQAELESLLQESLERRKENFAESMIKSGVYSKKKKSDS